MKNPVRQVCRKTSLGLIVLSFAAASPAVFAKPAKIAKEFTPQSVLSDVLPGTKRYQKNTMLAQTVSFNQVTNTSGGTDAASVEAVDLTYFNSSDCTGSALGDGRQTVTNGAFSIGVGVPFGLNTLSAFQVGNNASGANISDMSQVNSIAVVLKSTDGDVPQSNFSGDNFYCVQSVTCSGGECTSAAGQQDFELKTTAAIGDPADGGVIACTNGGLNNLIAAKAENPISIVWGGYGTEVGAQSETDGASNTTAIVTALVDNGGTPYAAKLCNDLTQPGGYDSDWFLPAGTNNTDTQLNCLFTNRAAIGGFGVGNYWSSTEFPGSPENFAWGQSFASGGPGLSDKFDNLLVRCVRAFTP